MMIDASLAGRRPKPHQVFGRDSDRPVISHVLVADFPSPAGCVVPGSGIADGRDARRLPLPLSSGDRCFAQGMSGLWPRTHDFPRGASKTEGPGLFPRLVMTPIRAPTTNPRWPAELSVRIAVLNRPPCDPANGPDQDSRGPRPSEGVAEASRPPDPVPCSDCADAALTRRNLPASFTAHRRHAAATAARAA